MSVRSLIYELLRALLFVSLTLPGVAAQGSNVRVIGTGGDSALMEALSLFADLPRRIKFCAWDENPCQLDKRDFDSLLFLDGEASRNHFPKELSFDSPNGHVIVDKEKRQVRMPATQLEKFGIAASVFAAWSNYYQSESVHLESLYKALFKEQWIFSRGRFNSGRQLMAVERSSSADVVLEEKGRPLVNLTPYFLRSFECPGNSKLKSARVTDSSSNGGILLDVRWDCLGDSFSARAWVGVIEGVSVEVRLFAIETNVSRLNEFDPSCSSQLIL